MKKFLLGSLICGSVFAATAQKTMLESNMLSAASLQANGSQTTKLEALNDGDDTTVATLSGTDMAVICLFDHPVSVSGLNIVAGEDLKLSPSGMALYGRNGDSDEWSNIGRAFKPSFDLPFTNYVFRAQSTKQFSQFKITVTATAGGGSTAEIAEIQLLGYDPTLPVVSTDSKGSFSTSAGPLDYKGLGETASSNKLPYSNGVRDDNPWNAWLQYEFNEPSAITGYTLGGGATGSQKNRPRVWELLASNDGNEWVTLDMRANAPDILCENYVVEYDLGKAGVSPDFAATADKILKMVDQKFYRDYFGGKYWVANWHPDPAQVDGNYNYWWMAHAVDAYVDAFRRTGSRSYNTYANGIKSGMYIAYDGNRRDLWNSYYDDMEWMCLACIRASQTLTNGPATWLEEAKQLFNWIWEGWDSSTGGILWNNGSQRGVVDSKNSCSNGPAMVAAALLYQVTGDEQYLEKAKMIFDFMYEHNLFEDGFVKDAPANDNRGWTFTYNQGTWLGGLLELYRVTGDKKYHDIAVDLIDKIISSPWYSPHGVMCEGGNDGDGALFKGILARYLTDWAYSDLLDEEHTVKLTGYMLENAKSLYSAALLKPDMTIMANWQNRGDANREKYCSGVVVSGLFLIEGADRLRREGFLNDDYSLANPNFGKPFKYYRVNARDNFGGSTVDFSSFTLLGNAEGAVEAVNVDSPFDDDAWYTLSGVRIDQPSDPGMYIHKGNKVLIK